MSEPVQEQASRSKTLSLAVTEYEHRAVRALAKLRETAISDLLREKTVRDLVHEYEDAMAILNG